MPVGRLLVVVDMQRDFVDGALGTPEARAIVPAVVRLLEQERAAGSAVAFTLDTHGADYLSTQEGRRLPVPHARAFHAKRAGAESAGCRSRRPR